MSRTYDIAGLRALVGPIKWEDNPILVRQKSRDFYWYSPVLEARARSSDRRRRRNSVERG